MYGRKIDVLFVTHQGKELCCVEWKKANVQVKTLMQQQTKNLRVTKCILSEILKLPMSVEDREGLSVLAIDWRGNANSRKLHFLITLQNRIGFDGYIVKVRKVEEIYVAELEGRLFVPRHATQIKRFKETLMHLFNWKVRCTMP